MIFTISTVFCEFPRNSGVADVLLSLLLSLLCSVSAAVGFYDVPEISAASCIPEVGDGVPEVPAIVCFPTSSGVPAVAGIPAVVSLPTLSAVPVAAYFPAVTGVPAVVGVHSVAVLLQASLLLLAYPLLHIGSFKLYNSTRYMVPQQSNSERKVLVYPVHDPQALRSGS
jgi:hypothetical protein